MSILTLQQIFPVAQTVTWRVYDANGYTTAAAPPHSNPMTGVYTATVDVNGTDIGIEWTGNVSGVFRQDFSPLNAVNSAVTDLNATLAQINSTVSSTASQVSTLRVNDIPMPESATESTLRYLRDVAILAQPGGGGGGGTALPVASQAEAEAGAVNNKTSTPLRVMNAIDANRAFSSQAEVDAGAEAGKVASPLTIFVRHGYVKAMEKWLAWEAPQSPARTPMGTKDDPIRVNTAALHDAALRGMDTEQVICYHPGEFETRGSSPAFNLATTGFIVPANGKWTILGSGATKLTKLQATGEGVAHYMFSTPFVGIGYADRFQIHDLALDCNYGGTTEAALISAAINININERAQCRNLRVTNAGAVGAEVFPIAIANYNTPRSVPPVGTDGGGQLLSEGIIQGCVLEQFGGSLAGCSGIGFAGNFITGEISGCSVAGPAATGVTGVTVPVVTNASGLAVAGGCKNVRIFGNHVKNMGHGLHMDTATQDIPADNFIISHNVFECLDGAVTVGSATADATYALRNWIFCNNTLLGYGDYIILFRGQCRDFLFSNNYIGWNQAVLDAYPASLTPAVVSAAFDNLRCRFESNTVHSTLGASTGTGLIGSNNLKTDGTPVPELNSTAVPVYADATASNGSFFRSSDHDNQFCFKDDNGTVTQLTFLAP